MQPPAPSWSLQMAVPPLTWFCCRFLNVIKEFSLPTVTSVYLKMIVWLWGISPESYGAIILHFWLNERSDIFELHQGWTSTELLNRNYIHTVLLLPWNFISFKVWQKKVTDLRILCSSAIKWELKGGNSHVILIFHTWKKQKLRTSATLQPALFSSLFLCETVVDLLQIINPTQKCLNS